MWKQRNLDRHKPNNGSNYSAIIKVDREIRCLYGYRDEVCTDDSPTFYRTDIDTILAKPLKTKQQWITRWKPAILSSRKRATRDAIRNTQPIYTFFGGRKPRTTINAAHISRLHKHKRELRKQRKAPHREITKGRGGFTVTGKKRSTSRQTKVTQAQPILRIKFPSVLDFFSKVKNKEEPADRFGDAGND